MGFTVTAPGACRAVRAFQQNCPGRFSCSGHKQTHSLCIGHCSLVHFYFHFHSSNQTTSPVLSVEQTHSVTVQVDNPSEQIPVLSCSWHSPVPALGAALAHPRPCLDSLEQEGPDLEDFPVQQGAAGQPNIAQLCFQSKGRAQPCTFGQGRLVSSHKNLPLQYPRVQEGRKGIISSASQNKFPPALAL